MGLLSGIAGALSLFVALVFQRTATDIAEVRPKPWFGFCESLTPSAWQSQGDSLLGLGGLVSGVLIWSLLVGAVGVLGMIAVEGLRDRIEGKLLAE